VKKITRLLRILWAFWYFFIFALIFILLYPVFAVLLSKEKWYKHANRLRAAWAVILFFLTGIFYRIHFEEKLNRKRAYIFCSNHFSYLDIPMSALVVKRNWRFMAKQELDNIPILNIFFRTVDIAVNRENPRESFKAVREASESLEKKMSIVMYPEGTISPHPPKMVRFKNGPFRLAIDQQVPIVPITMADNWKLLFVDGWKIHGRPGLSRVFVHSPVETKGMTMADVETLKHQVLQTIERQLNLMNSKS
jgi:1-acyl-sn-glycerol-3-phosphate acyltransferase